MLAVAGIFGLVVLGVVLLVAPVTHALCTGHEHAAIARRAVNEPALLFTRSLCVFFPFLKPRTHYRAGLYPRIFGRTLTTYIPVAVLHEEHPTLPVSLALLPLPAPCRRRLSLPLALYMCDTRVRTRVFTSLLCFRTCIYVCVRRDENPSLSLFYFSYSLFLPSYGRSVTRSLLTPMHPGCDFSPAFLSRLVITTRPKERDTKE